MNEVDQNYWKNVLPHPLSPNETDVLLYQSFMQPGTTLLLGCTHKLIPLSDNQLDIDPWYAAETVIRGDWRENRTFYNNIIGDGPLNLGKELAEGVLDMASSHCETLVMRVFNYKLPVMRIASYFPTPSDLNPVPVDVVNLGEYSFFVWRFR
jgi:hypothetical protein